jgi:hypothetical protein
MSLDNVEKKIREARFFLDKMADHERLAYNAKEPFDFFLSAFLSACRTIDYRLRCEQNAVYPTWRDAWDAKRTASERTLIKFLIDDRNVEVHGSGSSRVVGTEKRELGAGTHVLASGTLYVSGGVPGVGPLATIQTPTYNFTIDGVDQRAVDACRDYLRLLEEMVAAFKSEHGL